MKRMKPMVFILAFSTLPLLILPGAVQAQTLPQALPQALPQTAEDDDDRAAVLLVGAGLGTEAAIGLAVVVGVLLIATGGEDGVTTTTTTTGTGGS